MGAERRYANPPIIEAACEFRLGEEVGWDPTIPGAFYAKVRDDFPNKERRAVREVKITQKQEGLQHELRTTEHAVFLSDDRKTVVLLGAHVLGVSRLSPYPGWNVFKPIIQASFKTLAGIVGIGGLERVGLRYVNRIQIEAHPVELEDYFEYRPFLGSSLKQRGLAALLLLCTVPFSGGRDACNIRLESAASEATGSSSFVLDIDYSLNKPQAVSEQGAMEWVEAAHEAVREIFEGCITDRLRDVFQEIR